MCPKRQWPRVDERVERQFATRSYSSFWFGDQNAETVSMDTGNVWNSINDTRWSYRYEDIHLHFFFLFVHRYDYKALYLLNAAKKSWIGALPSRARARARASSLLSIPSHYANSNWLFPKPCTRSVKTSSSYHYALDYLEALTTLSSPS